MSINIDKVGGAEYDSYAVHVVRPASASALQLGEAHEVVASSQYDLDTSTITLQVRHPLDDDLMTPG